MILAYLDESNSDTAYYITALIVPDTVAIPLASGLDAVVEYAQLTYGGIASSVELHAQPLSSGTGDWDRLKNNAAARADITPGQSMRSLRRDVDIRIRGVELRGLRRRYGNQIDPHGVALTFVLERVQWSARDHDDIALVIADEVRGREAAYRRALRRYQEAGTWGWRAERLDRVADTIQFAPSSESRLLQAADLVAFVHQRTMRRRQHPRAAAFYQGLWEVLASHGRVKEASAWSP